MVSNSQCPANALCEMVAHAKRARRKEARPGELLAAALDLFVEKGYAATRVEEVARRAGVSKGTLFLYFPSKEELFKAVVRENISNTFVEWNRQLEHHQGRSAELLGLCIRSWWQQVGATKASGIPKLMVCEAGNFPELAAFYQEEVVQPCNSIIRRILQRGVESGEFVAVDPVYGVFGLVAPMVFLALWKHANGGCGDASLALDPERYIAAVSEMVLRGLTVPRNAKADTGLPVPGMVTKTE